MRLVDTVCKVCSKEAEALDRNGIAPCACGGVRERVYKTSIPASVQQDSIEGGMTFKHGLCWPNGQPRTFYSRREIRETMKAEGILPLEKEIPAYTDEIARNLEKNGQSKRPLATSSVLTPEDEAARVRNWHDHETHLQLEPK